MRYYYRAPAPELQGLVGSFYLMEMPHSASDLVRAEIPHIRFLCKGTSVLSVGEGTREFSERCALVCGPSFRTGSVAVNAGTLIIGASLTPAGWQRIVGVPAEDLADRKVDLREIRGDADTAALDAAIEAAETDEEMFRAVEAFLLATQRDDVAVREDFLKVAMDWISDPASPGVGDLVAKSGLSDRQVDRLCRIYFGASPKRVHRVFRVLNTAHRMATEDVTDWREVAGSYFDQSHLIRDFRDLIGCTPGTFMAERRMMMRFDIELRQQVAGLPRYCLIG
ncbi:MAG: helix-turn-helix domain-containing protein [Marinibacterium sp.]